VSQWSSSGYSTGPLHVLIEEALTPIG
jgi:hypothetical protein